MPPGSPLLVCLVALLVSALTTQGAETPTKIACIGDSITEGSGLSNPAVESYPAKLQRLMGPLATVRNFGVSGRTLLKRGDFPYWREIAYTQSRAFLPDVVLIKLGSNDAKPYNWRYGTNFVADYRELVASYAGLASKPRIILCTPAPVYRQGAFDIQPGTVATNIAPAIRDLASSLGLEVLDFHTRLAGQPTWFPDTVHPNSKGTSAMAAIVHDFIRGPAPSDTPPTLQVELTPARRLIFTWPASQAGMMLEAITGFTPTSTVHTVVETPAYSDGSVLRLTNTPAGLSRLFRLRRP